MSRFRLLSLSVLIVFVIITACTRFYSPGVVTQSNPDQALVGTIVAQTLTAFPSAAFQPSQTAAFIQTQPAGSTATAQVEIPEIKPGDLVDYAAQSGDTLPALAARFNSTVLGIRTANPQIPANATTLQPGMPIEIPIYTSPDWGTQIQIMPDSLFVNGPSVNGFDIETFVSSHPGWLEEYRETIGEATLSGVQTVNIVSTNFSISPRTLLALLEYQAGALSQPVPPPGDYPLGYVNENAAGLYKQLVWAANMLNDGYYGWRAGSLTQFQLPDGGIERLNPWESAATVAFQYYFSTASPAEYARATGQDGLKSVYTNLFGDPWAAHGNLAHIPADLQQPALVLPFPAGEAWYFTGGPHSGWGAPELRPWAGIDFAPHAPNCAISALPAVAMADGIVARSEPGVVMLDLDGDGNERTGWDILYLHISSQGEAKPGQKLKRGDPLGFPSCEGGNTTGTHVHVARKYNGEWIPADGVIPFDLEGWIVHSGDVFYKGTLRRGSQTVTADVNGNAANRIRAGE
jgi:LasA protease